MEIPKLDMQQLLDDVALWHESHQKANALFSRQLAPDFRLFNFFKINEMTLSQCLAFLLNENETHGQKDLFISQFLKFFELKKTTTLAPNKYQVYTEYTIENGRRIDILLTGNQHYIAIENKPWADDQEDQLKDYGEWLQKQVSSNHQWSLIYLCNNEIGEYTLPEHTDKSIKTNILPITFHQLVDWLRGCALHVQAPKIRLFVDALIECIQEDVNGEIDMSQQTELRDLILSKPKNISSAFLIAQNINEIKKELFKDFIENLNKQITDLEIKLDSDLERKYAGFHVKFQDDDSFMLRWEFDRTKQQGLFFGIRACERPQFDVERYKQLSDKMKKIIPKITWCEGKEWWPVWALANEQSSFPMPSSFTPEVWATLSDLDNNQFAKSVISIIQTVAANDDLRQLLK